MVVAVVVAAGRPLWSLIASTALLHTKLMPTRDAVYFHAPAARGRVQRQPRDRGQPHVREPRAHQAREPARVQLFRPLGPLDEDVRRPLRPVRAARRDRPLTKPSPRPPPAPLARLAPTSRPLFSMGGMPQGRGWATGCTGVPSLPRHRHAFVWRDGGDSNASGWVSRRIRSTAPRGPFAALASSAAFRHTRRATVVTL